MSENGNALLELRWQMQSTHSDDERGTEFSEEQFAVGYIRQQCHSSNSFVAMVLLFPKLWSESDRVSCKWNERRR